MRLRVAVTALLVLVLLGSACGIKDDPASEQVGEPQTSADPVDQEGGELAFEGADWEGWTGTYADVKPVTDIAVDELLQRVEDLDSTSWTAIESTTGAEVAFTPTHVRITAGPVAVHLDPVAVDMIEQILSVCAVGADCQTLAELEDDPAAEELFTQVGPVVSAFLLTQELVTQEVEDLLDEGDVALATVSSPVGDLDCLAHSIDDEGIEKLVGSEVVFARGRMEESSVSVCVDERGLVVSAPSESSGMLYSAWRPGVDGDVTDQVPPADAPTVEPEPGAELDQVFWGTWEPVYTDVRPATEAEADALEDRAAELGQREWTLVDATYGTEVAYTPERVRVRIAGAFDAYADPSDTAEPWNFTICDDSECVDTRKLADSDSPHLTSSFGDAMIYAGLAIARAQATPRLRIERHAALATVDSPVGPLDCVVTGARARDVETEALEGAPLVADWSMSPDPEDESFLNTQCVDSRGLVITGGGIFLPVLQVQSWHEGVEDDLAYPHRVNR